jgi:hypothetical protein
MKIACDKEVPVKKCTVEWVCPQCHCQGNCTQGAAPSAPQPQTAPQPPAPAADKSAARAMQDETAGPTMPAGLRS